MTKLAYWGAILRGYLGQSNGANGTKNGVKENFSGN